VKVLAKIYVSIGLYRIRCAFPWFEIVTELKNLPGCMINHSKADVKLTLMKQKFYDHIRGNCGITLSLFTAHFASLYKSRPA
jgi:hypothetical protein